MCTGHSLIGNGVCSIEILGSLIKTLNRQKKTTPLTATDAVDLVKARAELSQKELNTSVHHPAESLSDVISDGLIMLYV